MTALIVGANGQDGFYLRHILAEQGIAVSGITRQGLVDSQGALCRPGSIENPADVLAMLEAARPAQIYHLAAFHHSSEDGAAEDPAIMRKSFAVHTGSLLNFLDGMGEVCPDARLFYAASSHIFGNTVACPQTEATPLNPNSPYGISKAAGVHLCRLYRARNGLFAACGILYNHESPRRGPPFLSRRIADAVAAIEAGADRTLEIADPQAVVDWGYAPEYAEAMMRILTLPSAGDYIIASGRKATVADFLEAVFAAAGLDWKAHVRLTPSRLKKKRQTVPLIGDPGKLEKATGWRATTGLGEMAGILLDAARQRRASP